MTRRTLIFVFLVTVAGFLENKVQADEDWWSLQALARPTLPEVHDKRWARSPIDAFVLAKLEANGLKPSEPPDRRTLIRRVTYDLHGLPPTPDEIDAFVGDTSTDAYEKLIDRLLASPRYGERWGRHWLDLVHYGDTHGYDKDKRRDHAWPYRDYVIKAFNEDKPYSRFIKEQLAGDLLYPDDAGGMVATGFIVAGPWDFVGQVELREGTVDKEKTRLLDRDDMVSNTFSTFLSLTVHCARCHDHKFDPIPQKDYYRLQAVFAGIERGDRSYIPPEKRAEKAELEEKRKVLLQGRQTLKEKGDKKSDEAQPKAVADNDAALLAIDKKLQALPMITAYAALPIAARPIYVLKRGDVEQRGDKVTARGLSCVKGLDPNFKDSDNEGSRRVALADWIAHRENPLTWRSVVNRIWQQHFGRALVDSPSDFGRNGSQPTHPELLDWLAVEFRDNGGSFKKLHRTILLSTTYRQASAYDPAFARIDADNRYLWRQNRVRLDAESVRDSLLAIVGSSRVDLQACKLEYSIVSPK